MQRARVKWNSWYLLVIRFFMMQLLVVQSASAQTQLFVAPEATGDGSGSSFANSARYIDTGFWSTVRTLLESDTVTVTFLDGRYTTSSLTVYQMGHPDHQLILEAQSQGGAVFVGPALMKLSGVQNAIVRNFGFTGAGSTQLQIIDTLGGEGVGAARGVLSHHILVEGNQFYDAPTVYGAMNIRNGSHHITVYNNTFRNIGKNSGAHMMYNFAEVHHIKVIGNTFTDGRGDYIRFRHNADFGEVRNNNFLSTSKEFNLMFVRMAVFNDVNPGNEYHASNFLIRDNSFAYYATGQEGIQDPMGFTSTGYNPRGLGYLPSAEGGKILTTGTPEQKRQLMLDTMNIDLANVRVYNNDYKNVRYRFRYYANLDFGAKSQGWTGLVNIADAVNSAYLGAGDIHSDGVLDEKDVALFPLALGAADKMSFLLDDRVWFGDYEAADINDDGVLNQLDVRSFLDLFQHSVPDETLASVRALMR